MKKLDEFDLNFIKNGFTENSYELIVNDSFYNIDKSAICFQKLFQNTIVLGLTNIESFTIDDNRIIVTILNYLLFKSKNF